MLKASCLFLASTILVFFLFNALGFMLVTAVVMLLLTTSYVITYWRAGVGVGLAYFGLAYAVFGLALLGIGLLQSHAGCLFLIGDCYQPTLPRWMFEAKVGWRSGLVLLNGLALTFVYLNTERYAKAHVL